MTSTSIKAALVAVLVISAGTTALAQTPSTPEPTMSPSTPPIEEGEAKKKLEDQGYRDIRGLTSNPDGSMSGRATREQSEAPVTIDPSGNVRTR